MALRSEDEPSAAFIVPTCGGDAAHSGASRPLHSFESCQDALAELMNIGTGRAAAALSQLTHQRVVLDVPGVTLTRLDVLGDELSSRLAGDVNCVSLPFCGEISGLATLVLDDTSARRLIALLDEPGQAARDDHGADVLREVGNVLLNACIGSFGNLISRQVSFGAAELRTIRGGQALSFTNDDGSILEAVWAETRFALRQGTVSGFIAFLGSASTVSALVEAMEKRE